MQRWSQDEELKMWHWAPSCCAIAQVAYDLAEEPLEPMEMPPWDFRSRANLRGTCPAVDSFFSRLFEAELSWARRSPMRSYSRASPCTWTGGGLAGNCSVWTIRMVSSIYIRIQHFPALTRLFERRAAAQKRSPLESADTFRSFDNQKRLAGYR